MTFAMVFPEVYWVRRSIWIGCAAARSTLADPWLRRLVAARAYEGSIAQRCHATLEVRPSDPTPTQA